MNLYFLRGEKEERKGVRLIICIPARNLFRMLYGKTT